MDNLELPLFTDVETEVETEVETIEEDTTLDIKLLTSEDIFIWPKRQEEKQEETDVEEPILET